MQKIRELCKCNNIIIKSDIGNDLFKTIVAKDLYKLVIALKFNLDPKCLFGLFNSNYVCENYDRKHLFNIRGNKSEQLKYFNQINIIEKWHYYLNSMRKEPVMKVIRDIINDLKPWNIYASKNDDELEARKSARNYKKKS